MTTLKNDRWITKQVLFNKLIDPFEPAQVKQLEDKRVISYGVSSYGYDLRVANEFEVMENPNYNNYECVIDPKNWDPRMTTKIKNDVCIIPANSFALARTVERLKIPSNILCVCVGKSTYARCGIICNVTPFEPGWEGYATLEISNTTPFPAKIYANEGICQVIFFEGDICQTTYDAKQGKYQNQAAEIVHAKV